MNDHDPRIERVARAICRARGEDPDEEQQTLVCYDESGATAKGPPVWKAYADMVLLAAAAFDELRKIEREGDDSR